ncbi:MAG: hypothetical protein KAH32_06160, partial [Chlamydiia bacterium]|nr:hypothetical protein [Chlamydiia bacterium]
SANRTNEDPIDVQYINAGKKTISLLVTDDRGCTNKKTRSDLIKVPEPISKFIISANKRCIGDDISFEDKSSDNAFATLNTWMWDFGADASPADFNGKTPPNVDYSGGGIKNINLIIEDDLGCTDTSSQNYEIYVANASFTNDMTPGCSPADVTFINTSISTKTWNWEFGDPLSPSSKKENPTNLYVYPGVYDVQLIATSLGGCVDTVLVPAAVTVDGPYYDSITMVIDQPCLNSPSDPKAIFKVYGLHDVKRVKLDFGDASIAFDTTIADIYNPPAFIKINHTYSIQGEFTVKLTLEDDLNAGAGCGEVVYIPNLPIVSIGMRPTANFSTDAIAGESCVNMNVKFTDTSIDNDPNHNVNKWHYDFGDPLNSDSDIKDPTFKYLQQGTVYITHKATTSLGCFDTITKSLLILPGINDLSIATDDTLCEGATTVLDAATPTGGDGTYVFNWKESYNNVDWNNAISPHIDEDYTTHQTTPTVVETIYYKRKVTSNNCRLWGPVYTVTTFQTTDGGTLTPISSTECFDGNGGSIDLNGRIGSVLKWQSDTIIDFTTLTNIANVSDQLNYANLTDTTWYRAIVKNGVCPSDTSAVSVINIIPEIKGNIINPTDTLLCIQEDAGTIIATPPTGGDGSFTFQWQSSIDNISFSNIAGATAATYSPGGLNETTYFRREVITANNCDEISNVYKAEVIDAPIDDKLVSNPFVCQESPTANTQIIIYDSEPGIKYQLRLDIDDSPIGNPLIGNGNDLIMSTVTPLATTIYNIFASDTLPNGAGFVCGGIELSNKATITIIPIP